MASAKKALSPGALTLGWIVYILLILWAVWWIYGKIMLVNTGEMNAVRMVLEFIVPIIIVIILLLSRIWPLLAGILVFLEGVIAWFQYDVGFDMSFIPGQESFLTLTLPAVVIGILLIIYWQALKSSRAAKE